jgi:CHAT domain-containing protein/tetratricopeptide (TPR) repeat protein
MKSLSTRVAVYSALLFSIVSAVAVSAQTADVRPLLVGKPIERDLKGDEAHSYSLDLKAGQFLSLIVEQKGIDVVVKLFEPGGKLVAEIDSPNGIQGPEPVSAIIEVSGTYKLEVRSLEKTAAPGLYQAKIVDLRSATQDDRLRIAVQKTFADGVQLRSNATKESWTSAIRKFEEALPMYRKLGDKAGEGATLNVIGRCYEDLGDNSKALEHYMKALPIFQSTGDKAGEGQTWFNLGAIYDATDANEKAVDAFTRSVAIEREVGDKASEALALNSLGMLYEELGDIPKALDHYEKALPLFQAVGDRGSEGAVLNNIGVVESDLDQAQRSIEHYTQSLTIRREVGDKSGEGQTLGNIGLYYDHLGDKQKALDTFLQAAAIQRTLGNKRFEAEMLNNIGSIYLGFGETQKALDTWIRTLTLRQEVGDKGGEAATLNNFGRAYRNLGDYQKALDYYLKALPLLRASGHKRAEGGDLQNIGKIYFSLGNTRQALDYYDQSLVVAREIADKFGEATTLDSIGRVHESLKDWTRALNYYDQALTIRKEIGDKEGQGTTLLNLGKVYWFTNEKDKSIAYLGDSLPFARAVGDKSGEAITLDNLAGAWRLMNNPRLGIFYGKLSIKTYQRLRANVLGLDKSVQQTYLRSIESAYRKLAFALLKVDRLAEAQQVLNLFKDQQYFDRKASKQTDSLAFTERETALSATLEGKLDAVVTSIRERDDLKRSIGSRPATPAENEQIKAKEMNLNNSKGDLDRFLKGMAAEFAGPPDDRDRPPTVADVQDMQRTLVEVSSVTKQNAVAVYTIVGEDSYRSLIITPTNIVAVAAPVKGADVNTKALELWKLLRSPKYDPRDASNELYKIVFEPIASKLPANTKTILWSLDSNLRYVPMSALFDGKHYLAERYQNVIFTRADKERMTRAVNPAITGTGMGSSEAHTVELGGDRFQAAALPAVKAEINRIFTDEGAAGMLPGGVLLDERFTKPAMLSELKIHRPIVHIASHFRFQPGDEARSFLLLGDGSPFTLDEMKQQTDMFSGVDLLTLSACETAAQKPDANGREVDGFAELAQRLGAGAVMASLWKVSDDSTAELMARFYREYRGRGSASKAAALQHAQLALLSGRYNTPLADDNRQLTQDGSDGAKPAGNTLKLYHASAKAPFSHPFYWAPFILVGNWK